MPWLTGEELTIIHDKPDRTAGIRTASVTKKGTLTIDIEGLGGIMICTK